MANVPSAGHALDVLALLSRHTEPLPAASIARELDLPRSTVYHLLTVLVGRGFVTHLAEAHRYGLGVAAYELGSAYSRQAPLQRIARPVLARLVDETTHTGHFAVLHGRDVLYLLEERAPRRPPLVTDVGVRLPAHLTASGLALLAALPASQVRALFPHSAAFADRGLGGPSTPSALRRLLVETRSRGYAVEHDTVSEGFSSVASAVIDHLGMPVAAIAITWPSGEVDEATSMRLAASTRSTAAKLSARLHPTR